MEYLTVKEYAELKGCSERYVKKIAQDGKLSAEKTINDKWRPKYLIPLSALSEDLKVKCYKKMGKSMGLQPELKEEPLKQSLKPVKTAPKKKLDEYTEDERQQIAFWSNILWG